MQEAQTNDYDSTAHICLFCSALYLDLFSIVFPSKHHLHDSYCPPASSSSSFHLHPSKRICSPPDPVKINWEVVSSERLSSHEFHKVQLPKQKKETQFHVLAEQRLQREFKLSTLPDSKATQTPQKALNQSELQQCTVPFLLQGRRF